jgi:hypothetical protein
MTITVTTIEGATFSGSSQKAIIRQMRDTQWNRPDRKGEYMEDVAGRVYSITGCAVRPVADHFLTDLQAAGLLTID